MLHTTLLEACGRVARAVFLLALLLPAVSFESIPAHAASTTALPLPTRSHAEPRRTAFEAQDSEAGDAVAENEDGGRNPAPRAARGPSVRYAVIAPEGRPVTPTPASQPPDDAELTEEQRQYTRWAYGVLASLRFHKGEIELPNGLAKLNLSAGYEYLDAEDARRVLEEVWGNPAGEPVLGLIVPEGQTPFAADSWGIVLRYTATGHVADGERERTDFASLITPLKAQIDRLNAERSAAGYPTGTLLGWSALPRYDLSRHILQWGTMAQFSNETTRTMNYEVRLLGRNGVTTMSIVANANQYPNIVARVPSIIDMFAWNPGNTYDDYQEDVDARAPGELDTLITGTLAPPDEHSSGAAWLLLLLPLLGGAAWFVWQRRASLPFALPRLRLR